MTAPSHTFGGSAMDRYLYDFDTDDAGMDAGPVAVADEGSAQADAGDGGQAAGAAEAGAAANDAAEAAAPAAPTVDWNSPEAQQAFEQWTAAREQAAQQAAAQQAAAEQEQNRFAPVEEALGLLGIDPSEFKAYMQQQVTPTLAPLAEAAQQFQNQQSLEQITAALNQLGQSHPDLLGDGVNQLAEFKDDQGQPLFNPAEVRDTNQGAVVSAAVGILEASKDSQGNPTVPWTQAIQQAASTVAARDQIVAKAAVEQYKRQLGAAAGAPRDITNGGTAAGVGSLGDVAGDELAVARRFVQERGLH